MEGDGVVASIGSIGDAYITEPSISISLELNSMNGPVPFEISASWKVEAD